MYFGPETLLLGEIQFLTASKSNVLAHTVDQIENPVRAEYPKAQQVPVRC